MQHTTNGIGETRVVNVTLCWGESPAASRLREGPVRTCKMLIAAFTSRSATKPHDGQIWVRTDNDFCTYSPHLLHRCDVKCGATASISRPASSALYVRYARSMPQELSLIACARLWFLTM